MTKVRLAAVVAVGLALGNSTSAAFGGGFQLKSTSLPPPMGRVAQAQVYDRDGCHGSNLSPEIRWSDGPTGVRSYAVTFFDVDALGGRGWWHWIIYDIAPSVHELPAGAGQLGVSRLPDGARQGRNDFGGIGYDGPCPPAGTVHRYVVTLYALDIRRLPETNNTPGRVFAMIRSHSLGQVRRVLRYGR